MTEWKFDEVSVCFFNFGISTFLQRSLQGFYALQPIVTYTDTDKRMIINRPKRNDYG